VEPNDDLNLWGDRDLGRYYLGSGHPNIVRFIGGDQAIIATDGGSLFLIDTGQGDADERLDTAPRRFDGQHNCWVGQLLTSRDGRLAVTSAHDETIRLWNVGERRCTHVFSSHTGVIHQLSLSSRRLLLSSRAGVLKILSLRDGSLIAAFQADRQITTAAGTDDLTSVVGIDERGQIHFFKLENDHD
jgi:WD40 repeat protein